MNFKRGSFILMAVLAMIIGLYPFVILLSGVGFDLLSLKGEAILQNVYWPIAFYTHVGLGGIALCIGWILFIKKLRSRYIKIHRLAGRIYVLTALLSAASGIYLGLYSNGGMLAATGFISMGIIWLYTTGKAFLSIKAQQVVEHERMMIYSYATCFSGVTFRIWTPLFLFLFADSYTAVYGLMAWWAWLPNLTFAYFLHWRREKIFPKEQKIIYP